MRTRFSKLTKRKSGDAIPELTEMDKWILNHFDFLRAHFTHHRAKKVCGMQAMLAATTTLNLTASESEEDEEDNSKRSTPDPGSFSQQDNPQPTKFSTSKANTARSKPETATLTPLQKRVDESKKLTECIKTTMEEAQMQYGLCSDGPST